MGGRGGETGLGRWDNAMVVITWGLHMVHVESRGSSTEQTFNKRDMNLGRYFCISQGYSQVVNMLQNP